ncbi:hypothetical protein L6R52_03720 [Myxococcota bacterium]|nr:hypothetical protein [Myxococcota bacterium]
MTTQPILTRSLDKLILVGLLASSAACGVEPRPADRVDGLGAPLLPGSTSFIRTHTGAQHRAYASTVTADDGFAVAGSVYGSGTGTDGWVARYDATGALLWDLGLATTATDELRAITELTDGSLVVGGMTRAGAAGSSQDLWLARIDAAGSVLWQRAFGGAGHEWVTGLVESAAGTIAVTGETRSFQAIGTDVTTVGYFLELDRDTGDVLRQKGIAWKNTIERRHITSAAISNTTDGGYALVGTASWLTTREAWIAKLDATGDLTWAMRMTDGRAVNAHSVVEAPSGLLVTAGSACSTADCDLVVLAHDPTNGQTAWATRLDGAATTGNYRLEADADGLLVAGMWAPTPSASGDIWLARLDANGNVGPSIAGTWQKNFAGLWGISAHTLSNGDLLLNARGNPLSGGSTQLPYFVRTDAAGDTSCGASTALSSASESADLTSAACGGCEWHRTLTWTSRGATALSTTPARVLDACP